MGRHSMMADRMQHPLEQEWVPPMLVENRANRG